MNLTQTTQDLLKIAEDYRADHCRALLAKAAEDSRAILKAAHSAARHELRAALAPEHERLAVEIASAGARLITQRRLRDQRRVTAILRQAWPGLVQALGDRWQTPAGRRTWVVHHLSIALDALPVKGWVIRHPENWPDAEREQANRWLQARGIEDARFEPESSLLEGIRVCCGPNLLDASLDGLLADRIQIEGRLLHYLAHSQ